MDTLMDTLCYVMDGYAGEGLNGRSYLTSSADGRVLAVVTVAQVRDQRIADADLIVRLIADKIIIERDLNDKVLVDALVQAGVPRKQIVLAYAGEPVDAVEAVA